jgi:hypothetical protein
MNPAGQSARREYERRLTADRERRRSKLSLKLFIVFVAGCVAFPIIRFVAPFDRGTNNLLAGSAALVAVLSLGNTVLGSRATTNAWRIGAEGEELTALRLRKLPPGYTTLHDLRMPGSRANIDHLVIGPKGVFTVETKNYASPVEVKWKSARCAGRSMTPVIKQANRQAEVVGGVLGINVTPIVCVQGAGVVHSLWRRASVGGVRFCSGSKLVKIIESYRTALTVREVDLLEQAASVKL